MFCEMRLSRLFMPLAALVMMAQAIGQTALAGSDELRLRGELIAPATVGDVSGKADFSAKEGRRKFSVEIEGFAAGSMFDVEVANTIVGTVQVDAFGVGDLNFDDTADPDDLDQPFPANFPALNGGELVKVGPLEGNLQPN